MISLNQQEQVVAGIDPTPAEYRWKVKRGWIKVVVLGHRKGRVVDVRVGVEDKLNENEASREMVKIHHKRISKFFGDGGLDAKDNFRLLKELNIISAIKIDKNASDQAR